MEDVVIANTSDGTAAPAGGSAAAGKTLAPHALGTGAATSGKDRNGVAATPDAADSTVIKTTTPPRQGAAAVVGKDLNGVAATPDAAASTVVKTSTPATQGGAAVVSKDLNGVAVTPDAAALTTERAQLAPRGLSPPPPATPAPTRVPPPSTPPPCAGSEESCVESRCCAEAGEQCYEKSARKAYCRAECFAGPDMSAYLERSEWTCREFGERTPGLAKKTDWTSMPVPRWVNQYCSSGQDDCQFTRCCSEEGMQCYAKDESRAQCKPACVPGPDMTDVDGRSWSCTEIGPRTPGKVSEPSATGLTVPAWARTQCSVSGENCHVSKCCSQDGHQCYAKDDSWASCKPDCEPGPQPEDRADEDWTCDIVGPRTPGLAEAPPVRRGSFLVVGDLGSEGGTDVRSTRCKLAVARAMDAKMSELGDVKFVVNVGDSFYSSGVLGRDDEKWDSMWRWIYSVQLRGVPWYSVYGNHDYHSDPCACSDRETDCAQVNYDVENLEYFQMPGTSYFKEFPDMGIEVVGLDLNNFCEAPHDKRGPEDLTFEECTQTDCAVKCLGVVRNRTLEALNLFFKRAEESTAKSLVVFSHYPTDYFVGAPLFLQALTDNSRRSITYFGGHRHSVDNTSGVSIEPNKYWVVGEGGDKSCDSDGQQGFVVGEIWGDSSITTYPVFVDRGCCTS